MRLNAESNIRLNVESNMQFNTGFNIEFMNLYIYILFFILNIVI